MRLIKNKKKILVLAVSLILISTVFVSATGSEPTYDPLNNPEPKPSPLGTFLQNLVDRFPALANSVVIQSLLKFFNGECWDKSSIEVTGECIEPDAVFTIKNVGDGDMADTSEYRVYINGDLEETGTFQLDAGESIDITVYDANCDIIKLEADQRPGHQGNSHPRATIEDCGCGTCDPCININKEADVATASMGQTITYTYNVTNCGDVTLAGVTVVDDKLGSITLGTTTLSSGGSTTGTANYTVQESDLPGPIENTATATGITPTGGTVTDTDTESVDLIPPCSPSIDVVKEADVEEAEVGQTITYTYNVTNDGNSVLHVVQVVDDKLGSVTLGDTTLDPLESTTGTANYTVQESDLPGPIENTATATGTAECNCEHVSDQDSESVDLIPPCSPSIDVVKEADVEEAEVGQTITYTYNVTNDGNSRLTNVKVADNKLGSITLGATTLNPGQFTTGVKTYEVKMSDLPGPIVNIATATGIADCECRKVSDQDDESVGLIIPCLDEVWVDDDYHPGTPGWYIDHFPMIQPALDRLGPYGTAWIYDGIYDEDLLIDDSPCDNTGITITGAYGCFPTDEATALIKGNAIISVDYVTILHLEFYPTADAAVTVEASVTGTALECNKFRKDCIADAVGVNALGTTVVDADLNWWGRSDGPDGGVMDDEKTAKGLGVKIIGEVLVEAWIGIHAEISQPMGTITVDVGTPVFFDATGSFAYSYGECCGLTPIDIQYMWNFDDGRQSSAKQTYHTFGAPGTYEVRLTVDSYGIPGLSSSFMYDWAYVTVHVIQPDI
jgi:uncharacterized repeat protein (TIGR01451 family)